MHRLLEEARRILLGEGLTSQQTKDVLWQVGYTFRREMGPLVKQHFRKSDTSAIQSALRRAGAVVRVHVGPVYNPNERELESFAQHLRDVVLERGWVLKIDVDLEDDVANLDGEIVAPAGKTP